MRTCTQMNRKIQDRKINLQSIKELKKLVIIRDQCLDRTVPLNTIGTQIMVGQTVTKDDAKLFVNPMMYMTMHFQKS